MVVYRSETNQSKYDFVGFTYAMPLEDIAPNSKNFFDEFLRASILVFLFIIKKNYLLENII